MLSCYRWMLDGKEPMAVVLSNVQQHSWLGYYVQAPRLHSSFRDRGSGEMEEASERSIELRLSRSVGYGVHEDVFISQFSGAAGTVRNWQSPIRIVECMIFVVKILAGYEGNLPSGFV